MAQEEELLGFDAFLLILTGLPGIILFAMIFSQHPTVQINFQLLLLNPVNLIFAWKTISKMRKGKLYWYYEVWGWCLLVALLLQIWQSYAEGMSTLAFSLLMRYAIKSTLLDLNSSKLAIQKQLMNKLRKDK